MLMKIIIARDRMMHPPPNIYVEGLTCQMIVFGDRDSEKSISWSSLKRQNW